MARGLALVLLAGVVSGCTARASRMNSSVEAFAANDAIRPTDRVIVLPAVEPGRETLEHGIWVRLAEEHLSRRGIAVTRSPEEATLFAAVGLGMDSGRDVTSTFAVPQWGVTGYSGANTVGTVNRFGNTASINTTTTYNPQYGVTGYQTGARTDRVFRRARTLVIARTSNGNAPQPIFQSRVISEGGCGVLSVLTPNLVDALFATFPSGGTRRVTTDLPSGC